MVASFRVVLNDCAAPPVPGLTHLYTRPGGYGEQNVVYTYQNVVEGLPERLTAGQQDWLDILGALYACDVACRRGKNTDWARAIELWLGVREPDRWRPLAERFQRVFSALTYDDLVIHFEHDPRAAPTPRQVRDPLPDADSVALLSGGVDSLAGAGRLLSAGRVPVFLSHQNSGAVGRALQAVDEGLKPLGKSAGRLSFTARLEHVPTDSSQRSRSMLYMGIACLLAATMHIDDVYLNENGVMAIHVPLTEARAGSFTTRTANPDITREFGRLASAALDHNLTIRNLLVTSTKPEVVRSAIDLGLGPVLRHTVSCWSVGRNSEHCGYCVPCLIRQISCEHAGAPDGTYTCAPFDRIPADASWAATAKDNVVQLAAHATDLSGLDDEELEMEFPELLTCGDQLTQDESLAMHRRWADQCLTVMRAHPAAAAFVGS